MDSAKLYFISPSLPPPVRVLRLRNDLDCVGWGVKLYSLTHYAVKLMRMWFYSFRIDEQRRPLMQNAV